MKRKEQTDGPPCEDMENLLQQVADGSARGIRKYFALFHCAHCYHCGSFLKRMQALVSVLRNRKENVVPIEAMDRLNSQVKDLDAKSRS
jgi:hypothetical protein